MLRQKFMKFLDSVGLARIFRYYLAHKKWEGSSDYWQKRYQLGFNSGAGSYNRLAEFKAKVVNDFVKKHQIQTVIEYGCGDGNQLLLSDYPAYIGFDVAEEAIEICKELFQDDAKKRFEWSGAPDYVCKETADMTLSLDVIYHLTEDDVFEKYMRQLFDSSKSYVCIYSCNDDNNTGKSRHVKNRVFTDWIEHNYSADWKLISFIKNEYPFDPKDPKNTSFSDFYFYERIRK